MIPGIKSQDYIHSFNEAQQIFDEKISKIVHAPALGKNQILRFELKVSPIDILAWLDAQENHSKIYWSSRDGTFEVAGVGLTYALHGTRNIEYDAIFTELERYLTFENKNLKFFGGIAFNQNSLDKDWESFGSYRFVLPRFEMLRRGREFFLACNVFSDLSRRSQIPLVLNDLQTLKFTFQPGSVPLSAPISREDVPTKENWLNGVEKILSQIEKANVLQKVVLARKSGFEFTDTLNVHALLKRLKNSSPECFHFCFSFDDGSAFVGASPERLFKREGRTIKSEAIAGTRPRGGSPSEDTRLRNELLNSDKERREHMYVVDTIRENLKKFCASVDLESKVNLLPLTGGQHLLTFLEGLLLEETDDAVILKQLHPTPAVGGFPTEKALKAISDFEPFKRGWYAGPVGYIGFDTTEFAVGIRSGLVKDNQLYLYAGAGIVEGSSPANEWNEIETKISNFTEIFKNG